MEAYAKEIGVNFVYKQTKDTGEKITACENYISSGVDAIICHVQDGPSHGGRGERGPQCGRQVLRL